MRDDSQDRSLLPTRRRILQAAAASGAAGLGGCTDLFDGDGERARSDDGRETGDGGAETNTDDENGDDSAPFLSSGPTVRLETVADGLTYPTDLAGAGTDPERLFVTDQVGSVYVIEDGEMIGNPFLDIRDQLVDLGIDALDGFDERGLLGIALHPEFAENRRLFLRYSAPSRPNDDFSHRELLSEFRANEDATSAQPDSERHVLEVPQPSWEHNSGNVLFGPDGYLYVTTGDGGGSIDDRPDDWYDGNPGGFGQDTTRNLLGGVLRIDVDGAEPYEIPDDNPLVDEPDHLDEYYAWGFRNPWGASFDGEELYVADVGEILFESVNRVERGGNYGWNVREGANCFSVDSPTEPPEECPDETPTDVRGGEPLRDPIVEYPQEIDEQSIGSAIIGGSVYRGEAIPELEGSYVFGDWSADGHGEPSGSLFAASPPSDEQPIHEYYEERDLWPIETLALEADGDAASDGELARYVSGFGRDGHGELYVLTTETSGMNGETGEVHRISPPD